MLKLRSFNEYQDRSMMTPVNGFSPRKTRSSFAFTTRLGFNTHTLALYLDSMARVTRRVVEQHFVYWSFQECSWMRYYPKEPSLYNFPLTKTTIYDSIKICDLNRDHKTVLKTLSPNPFRQLTSGNFHMLFSILFIFPSQYLFAIGLMDIFRFTRITPRTLSSNPKLLDSFCMRVQLLCATYPTFTVYGVGSIQTLLH